MIRRNYQNLFFDRNLFFVCSETIILDILYLSSFSLPFLLKLAGEFFSYFLFFIFFRMKLRLSLLR